MLAATGLCHGSCLFLALLDTVAEEVSGSACEGRAVSFFPISFLLRSFLFVSNRAVKRAGSAVDGRAQSDSIQLEFGLNLNGLKFEFESVK